MTKSNTRSEKAEYIHAMMFCTKIIGSTMLTKSKQSFSSPIFFSLPLFILSLMTAQVAAGVDYSRTDSSSSSHQHVYLNTTTHHHHYILKSACQTTLYPELCLVSLGNDPYFQMKREKKKPTSLKEVIKLSLNISIDAVEQNYLTVKSLLKRSNLTVSQKRGLSDCLEMTDETRDELHEAVAALEAYPSSKPLKEQADDLKTLLSAAMTNLATCLEGFPGDHRGDVEVRGALAEGEIHAEKMCSNALAMICNMTDTDILNHQEELEATGRKLSEEEGSSGWPQWMSSGDRRLLQSSSSATADVVVAKDGSGDYKTISEAVANAPERSRRRYVIRIRAGVYKENVVVPNNKINIMFVGDGRSNTIVTGSKNMAEGTTTFHSATVAVVGERFLARDMAFQNTAGPSKQQAVALRVGSDLSAFFRCDISAYHDTLYVHSNRQFFIDCKIHGTVDFIFGNAAVVFQNCLILARRPNPRQKNTVTAQGRNDPNQNTGIVIQKCSIAASSELRAVQNAFPTFLGRPWGKYSRTVIMHSSISDAVAPAGWLEWAGDFAVDTAVYREYQNYGPGARTSERVKWKGFKVMTSGSEAMHYTPGSFLDGRNWLGSTGFPFKL